MKDVVSNMLGYWKYQVDNNKCTEEQLNQIAKIGVSELCSLGTAEDIAAHYGKTPEAVRNIIHRNYAPPSKKPKRRVFYDFGWFTSVMPKSWRK